MQEPSEYEKGIADLYEALRVEFTKRASLYSGNDHGAGDRLFSINDIGESAQRLISQNRSQEQTQPVWGTRTDSEGIIKDLLER